MKYDICQALKLSNAREHLTSGQVAKMPPGTVSIIKTADIRGKLPKYLRQQIYDAGYEVCQIGGTTNVSNVFALYIPDGYHCHYCGRSRLRSGTVWSQWGEGIGVDKSNLEPEICPECKDKHGW